MHAVIIGYNNSITNVAAASSNNKFLKAISVYLLLLRCWDSNPATTITAALLRVTIKITCELMFIF